MGPYRYELFPFEPNDYRYLLPLLRSAQEKNCLKWVVLGVRDPGPEDVIKLLSTVGASVVATLDRKTDRMATVYLLHNFTGRRAQFHFIGDPALYGKRMRDAGREGIEQIFRYFSIETLWSEVPITNRLVRKIARDIGFKEKTVLTNAFNIVNTQTDGLDTVDGVIIQLNKDEMRW